MDTIKKILHPKDSSVHKTDETTDTVSTQRAEEVGTGTSHHTHNTQREPPFPHETEQQRLNQEAGFDPSQQPQPRAGHHHPRQPVGATDLPPNHKPREHFATAQQQQQQVGGGEGAGVGAAREQEDLVSIGKQVAESGNNFPGTNPHPAHSALGNQSMTGEKGTFMPGRE